MPALFRELRITLRLLFRNGGSTLIATLILTLGLAVSIYMFGAIDSFILRPLPFPESNRLTHVELSTPDDDSVEVPIHDYLDWRAAQKSIDSLEAYYPGTINLSGNERAERFDGAFVTSHTLSELRVQPYLGRLFLTGEDQPGTASVAIISFDLWRNRYHSDRNIIGTPIRVNAKPAVVVGVMPPGFHFPVSENVWVPLSLDVSNVKRGQGASLEVFGRLKHGVTLKQAQAEFRTISQRLAKEFPDTNKDKLTVVKPLAYEYVGKQTRTVIYTMFALVLLVLVIACANVANLTLVRMISRAREFSIRSALGAGRGRLVFQVLVECLFMSTVAGVIAVFLSEYASKFTIDTLRANPDTAPPFWVHSGADWRTILFSVTLAIISAILAGLLPALRASRSDLNTELRQGGYSVAQPLGRTSRILVIAQITLSCVLLISAGLMTRTILNLKHVNFGANVENIMSGRIGLFESKYPDLQSQQHFYDSLLQNLSTLPGVKGATLSNSLPGTFSGNDYFRTDRSNGDDSRLPPAYRVTIAPNYFDVFQVRLLQGRHFDSRDRKETQKVAIVNQMLAEKSWPGESAIGHRVRLGDSEKTGEWFTVVGVVSNVWQSASDDRPGLIPGVYLPLTQSESRFISIAIRTEGDPARYAESLRKTVERLDPDLPVYWLRTLDEWIRINSFGSNFLASLFGIFAFVAIALAAVGQYAVLAYTVGQRTKEIGVRRALGALDETIIHLFLNQGLRQLGIALVIGLPISVVFGQLISGELIGVHSYDPVTLLIVPLSLSIVSLVAAIAPTKRALSINPAVALRAE
jgi:putative ABC transport system permease protein